MKDKPKSNIICPACHGLGYITEDETVYEFVTRDPQTNKCLVCNGKGHVYPTKKLPTGHVVSTLATQQKRLNVSKKAVIHPELPEGVLTQRKSREKQRKAEGLIPDTGVGYRAANPVGERAFKVYAGRHGGDGIVAVHQSEPYFLKVVQLVRSEDRLLGTWTPEDEEMYVLALEQTIEKLKKEAMNG